MTPSPLSQLCWRPDEEHKRCDEVYQRARNHAETAVNFLWLISVGKITPLKFAVRPDDEELQQYFSSRIKECLKVPMVPAGHAPVDTLFQLSERCPKTIVLQPLPPD